MRILQVISFFLLILSSCTKNIEYNPAIASAMFDDVQLFYSDDDWGAISTLKISHEDNRNNTVNFNHVSNQKGESITFVVPHPDESSLVWKEQNDYMTSKGTSSLNFSSQSKNITLVFTFSINLKKGPELGNSSLYIESVTYNNKTIKNDNPTGIFNFNISNLI